MFPEHYKKYRYIIDYNIFIFLQGHIRKWIRGKNKGTHAKISSIKFMKMIYGNSFTIFLNFPVSPLFTDLERRNEFKDVYSFCKFEFRILRKYRF